MDKNARIILVILLLIDTSFMYLFEFPSFISTYMNNYQKLFLVVVIIGLTILYAKKIINKRYVFTYSMFLLSFMFIIAIILGVLRYNQGIKAVLSQGIYILVPFAYFLLNSFINDKKSLIDFENIIVIFGTIQALLFDIQYLIYNMFGIVFLNIDINKSILSARFGQIRIYESSYLLIFATILSISFIFRVKEKKLKILYIISTLINSYYLLSVLKSRIATVSIVCIIILLLLIKKRSSLINRIGVIISIVIVMLLLTNTTYGKLYIESMDTSSENVRERATEYYIEQIKKIPITGVGFINASTSNELKSLVMGPKNIYYRDDVGIINIVYTFGAIGVIWYILIIVKMIRCIIRSILRKTCLVNYIELIVIFIFILTTSFTMIITDSQRIFILPCVMVIFDSHFKSIHDERNIIVKSKVSNGL